MNETGDTVSLATRVAEATSVEELFNLLGSSGNLCQSEEWYPGSPTEKGSANDGLVLLEVERRIQQLSDADLSGLVSPNWINSLITTSAQNSSNNNNKDLICHILSKVLSCIPAETFFTVFQVEILQLLSKASVPLVSVAADKICDCIIRFPTLTLCELESGCVAVVVAAVRGLVSKEEGRHVACKMIINKVAQHKKGAVGVLIDNSIVSKELCNFLHDRNDIVRFRIHELIVHCCTLHADCVDLCVEKGFLGPLMAEVEGNDVLCKLNALELLADLVSDSSYAAEILEKEGVLSRARALLLESQENPDAIFVFPATIRFFGYVAKVYPTQCCTNYPEFLPAVFDMIAKFEYLEPAQRLLCFDTLSLIGSTKEGKQILASQKDAMITSMKCFGEAIRNGPQDIRIRHLEALHDLIFLKPEEQDEEILNAMESWFHLLDASGSLEFVFKLFKQPISATHIAAGSVIKALSLQLWGQKLIAQESGMLEYLLNRSTETQMNGRYVKFEILESLIKSPHLNEIFSGPDVMKMKEYVKLGPYYVKGLLEIDMEEGT